MVTGASDDERSDSDFSSISPRDGHLLDSCAASFAFTQTSVAAASQPPPPRPPPQLQRSPSPPPREATAHESSLLQFVIGWFSSKTTPVRSPATAAKGAAPALPNTQTAVDALAALSGAKPEPDATLVSSGGPAERTLVPDDDRSDDDSDDFVVRRASVRPRSALLADEGDDAVEDDDGGADDYDALVRSPGRGLSPEPRRSTVRAAERTRPAASRLKKRLF